MLDEGLVGGDGEGFYFSKRSEIWLFSIIGAICVGLSGVFPLLVIPIESGPALKHGESAKKLRLMLSFAVGSLLGDVFLHLLPEVWAKLDRSRHDAFTNAGLWVILGLLGFMCIEKLLGETEEDEEEEKQQQQQHCGGEIKTRENGQNKSATSSKAVPILGFFESWLFCQSSSDNKSSILSKPSSALTSKKSTSSLSPSSKSKVLPAAASSSSSIASSSSSSPSSKKGKKGAQPSIKNGKSKAPGTVSSPVNNNQKKYTNGKVGTTTSAVPHTQSSESKIKITGYLNLFANVVDNFTHGLAVGCSFCISTKVGVLTTFAILLHEIPHEVGDFAILLQSGFNKWKAAKAQVYTASGGMIGAITALVVDSTDVTGGLGAWILPFTSGGFMYIALVTVVPDLLQEKQGWESLKQMAFICLGILSIIVVTFAFD